MTTPRTEALRRLWQHCVDGLTFRHQDPRVTVTNYVEVDGETVHINLCMWGLRDNDNPERNLGRPLPTGYFRDAFKMSVHTNAWPGQKAAELALVAAWAAYTKHEAMEQVRSNARAWTWNLDRWHPHDYYSPYSESTRNATIQCLGERDGSKVNDVEGLTRIIAGCFGTDVATREIRLHAAEATNQLRTETEYAAGLTEEWQ